MIADPSKNKNNKFQLIEGSQRFLTYAKTRHLEV